jgi:hypothetical protein
MAIPERRRERMIVMTNVVYLVHLLELDVKDR